VRPGKPDYNTSQLQILSHVIEKGEFLHPVADLINRWKTACGNKTSALIMSEIPSELHVPQISGQKKTGAPKGKSIDFKSILAAMMKQDKPRKLPTRTKPSENAAEILNAETEIERDFEAEPTKKAADVHEFTDEEKELKKIITSILEKKDAPQQQPTKVKTVRQGVVQVRQSKGAPASLNPDLER